MSIADSELERNFIVVDERATVREVRDQVAATGDRWTYVVVQMADGHYAVLWLSELVAAMQQDSEALLSWMLDAALNKVPDLLASRAANAVEQAEMDTGAAKRLARKMPGGRLVVLADGQVVGVLVGLRMRGEVGVDLDWLYGAPGFLEEVHVGAKGGGQGGRELTVSDEAYIEPKGFGVMAAEEAPEEPPVVEVKPEKRWINAEIEDHERDKPLQMGQGYTLAFDVDTEARATALAADEFRYEHKPGEELVELTVQLASDDFEIYSGPQTLRVPRAGKSRNKARFDVEPKHTGEGVINAVFLKDGNFIQLMTIKLHTGAPGVLAAETLGRPLDAAFVVQPRDVNLTILNTGAGFQVILTGAVGATATLPLTLQELDQMIAQVRQELLKIVHLEVGPTRERMYQTGIDIPPEVNQAALQRLARAGYRLYQRIFYGPGTDAQANLLGDRLRLMAQGDTLKIQIFSQQFTLPWGILYVADKYDPEHVNPELFLGLKHIIEYIPLQPGMQVIEGTIASRPGLTVSLNVNADIDQQMEASFIADQQRYWDKIGQSGSVKVVVRQTKDEVMQALANTSTPDQVIYFYCHAISKSLAEGGGPDASMLVLSGDGRLSLGDLYVEAPLKKVLAGQPLVFINACESAELSPLFYDGFVPYFMAKGARGVIGTECETPALFATEWARRFFDRFLAGEPLGRAFLDLRREFYGQHNNLLGLMYALYVDGDTQIAPAVQVA